MTHDLRPQPFTSSVAERLDLRRFIAEVELPRACLVKFHAGNYAAFQATHEYARRWGCECGFRDAKHLLGLKAADIADPQAYARMFTLVAIALLLLAIIGCEFLSAGPQAKRRLRAICSDRGAHCEMSLFAATHHSRRSSLRNSG